MIKGANTVIRIRRKHMPTSPLYDSTYASLHNAVPAALESQIDTLALAMVGVVVSGSSAIGRIAHAMPLPTTQEGKEQRLERLVTNPRITPENHFQPIARAALQGLRGQRVSLIIDRLLLRHGQNVLVVSAAFRRRSIPLAWSILPHTGASALADQQSVLTTALALLPERVRVTVHGDSEFRSQALYQWLRDQDGDAMLGIQGGTLMRQTPTAAAQPLATAVPDAGVTYLHGVYLTEAQTGPVNVIAWWAKDADGKRILRAVMTNLPARWQTYRLGRRRMWIETIFRDWQSQGFDLEASGVRDPKRFARLLLVLCLVYLWLVCIGRYVVKKGWRRRVDRGPARAWRYSLFMIGQAWHDHLASLGRPLPQIWVLYT
jgi:hypothetical protein